MVGFFYYGICYYGFTANNKAGKGRRERLAAFNEKMIHQSIVEEML